MVNLVIMTRQNKIRVVLRIRRRGYTMPMKRVKEKDLKRIRELAILKRTMD